MGIGRTMAIPTLAVTDLAEARRFYGQLLGFEEIETPGEEDAALFRVGNGSPLLVYERPSVSGSTATACAFTVENVEETVARLRKQGVRFEEYDMPEMGLKTVDGVATMDGFKSAWFKDPWGNILAIEDAMVDQLRRGSTTGAYEGAHP
ncbi:VOC family protein [Vulgatibacter sp.]|uniref:VOC family protein n=1 Tax=Vulgatibacter sp. TaxID=1971226 RepID=UPI003565F0F3